MKRISLLLLLLLAVQMAHAVPHLTGYVNDYANLLSPQEEEALANRLGDIERNTTVQIAIVTVDSTEGTDKAQYATQIGQENGVGQKATDNGVVILWVTGEQHGGFIATGRGIEYALTDYEVTRIGKAARPLFNDGQYYQGMTQIVDGIDADVQTRYEEKVVASDTAGSPVPLSQFIRSHLFLIVLIGGLLFLFFFIHGAVSNVYRGSYDDYPSTSTDTHYEYDTTTKKARVYYYRKGKRVYYKKKDEDGDDLAGYAAAAYVGYELGKRRGGGGSGGSSSSDSSSSSSSSYHSSGGGFGGFGGGGFGGGGGGF